MFAAHVPYETTTLDEWFAVVKKIERGKYGPSVDLSV